MKMPAKSVTLRYEATRSLDSIALGLVRQGMGVEKAYRQAALEVDAQAQQRFPVTKRGERKFPLFST